MATYKLRPRAVTDLRSIRRWIAKDSPQRARTFIVELTEHFQRLADMHLRHRFVPELGPDIRIAVHGNYNVYYRFIWRPRPRRAHLSRAVGRTRSW